MQAILDVSPINSAFIAEQDIALFKVKKLLLLVSPLVLIRYSSALQLVISNGVLFHSFIYIGVRDYMHVRQPFISLF